MAKILCIDDAPNQYIDEESKDGSSIKDAPSLMEVINNIFRDSPYQIIFKETGDEGVKAAAKDAEIKLVLLDVLFPNQEMEGPEIAEELQKKAPHVKIVVLTSVDEKGKKISFGHKPNVVHYIIKKELLNAQVFQKLRNLSKAIIEDYDNKNWEIEYLGKKLGVINLHNKITQETFGINIPEKVEKHLLKCMNYPNKPVLLLEISDLSKVHEKVNTNVLEGTQWKTWGILSKDGCGKGQLKLVVGSVVPATNMSGPEDFYVLQSQFSKFKKDIEERLVSVEKALKLKVPKE